MRKYFRQFSAAVTNAENDVIFHFSFNQKFVLRVREY